MARKNSNIHYIYKTTCNVTGKWYVGMHSTSNLDDGYMGSGKILKYSIRKYGKDAHTKEILEYCNSRENLVLREIEIVNKELISDGLCINLKEGGEGGGGFWCEEHMLKCQKAGNESFLNRLKTDDKFKNEISNTLLMNVKKCHKEGKIKYDNFKFKTHSDETKRLMSEVSKGIGVGETNSQYGTCWVTRNGENKKIKKDNLGDYLSDGWLKDKYCSDCNIKIKNSSTKCRECSNISKRLNERPTTETLLKDISNLGYSATGRKYSVSDNTIRKWVK